MDRYKNFELYKDLSRCEDDLYDFINRNFLIIDSSLSLRVLDIVPELPDNAEQGDVYIKGNQIAIFDGISWRFVDLKNGMSFYSILDDDFLYYLDGSFQKFGVKYGYVSGEDHSNLNSVAIFKDKSGKRITDSEIYIFADDLYGGGAIFDDGFFDSIYAESLHSDLIESETILAGSVYSDFLESDSASIQSLHSTDSHIDHLTISKGLKLSSITSSVDGVDAELDATNSSNIMLSNPDLKSIANINSSLGGFVTLTNKTGREVTLKNGEGIITGEGKDIDLKNDGSIILNYIDDNWHIAGGAGLSVGQALLQVDTDAPTDSSIKTFTPPVDAKQMQIINNAGVNADSIRWVAGSQTPSSSNGALLVPSAQSPLLPAGEIKVIAMEGTADVSVAWFG